MSALAAHDLRELLGADWGAAIAPIGSERSAEAMSEFLRARCGFVTCSRFKDVLDFTKAGKEGSKRAAYRKEVVIERVTGNTIDHFVSGPMRDGIEREPLAKMAYEARTGRMLIEHSFRRHPDIGHVGGTPDALIGDAGGLEIKCPTPLTHLQTLFDGMDAEHQPQVQGYMWVFGRAWWDFCSYCPHFEEPLRTYIQRIPRDDAYIAMLAEQVALFNAEVAAQVTQLRKIAHDAIDARAAA